jgi:hypothetical protein
MLEPENPTDETPILACNLTAIDDADRPRYNELVKRIRAAMRDRREIPDGYVFTLDHGAVALPEAAEWISMERLCCPFLTLQLSASGTHSHWLLTLSGPAGIKPLLDAEFPG